jgi:protein TonB
VRVKVEIAADGSFRVSLLTSSGDEDIDQRVLDALKRWKWRPALQDGQPVASTQRLRFNFEVQ